MTKVESNKIRAQNLFTKLSLLIKLPAARNTLYRETHSYENVMHVVKTNTPRIKRYLKRTFDTHTHLRVKTKYEIVKGDRQQVGCLIPITGQVPTLEECD